MRFCRLLSETSFKYNYEPSPKRDPITPLLHLKASHSHITIRVVESESLKVDKSLKIGKNWKKSEKSDLISY